MKPIKEVTVHPYLGNEVRNDVVDWCQEVLKDNFAETEEDFRWRISSNYDRSYDGSFDMFFKDLKDAHWFILCWGGDVVNIEYEDVPEQYAVLDKTYDSLFE